MTWGIRVIRSSARTSRVESVAVVGCGYWGINHVRVLTEMSALDVVPVDASADAARRCAERHRLPHWSTSLEDVAGDVDAVVLATPPGTHRDLGLLALEADCHLMVEKPMTTNLRAADELITVAQARGRTLAVGHTFLFSPTVETLRSVIDDAAFGTPVHISSERLNLGLYRSDVDVVWDLAPHDISILNHLLSAEPVAVNCWSIDRRSAMSDVSTLRLIYTEPEVSALVHLSWLHPEKVRRMAVVGTQQMAQMDEAALEPIRVFETGSRIDAGGQAPPQFERGSTHLPLIPRGEPLKLMLSEFLECCETGREPRSSGKTGRAVIEALHAADLSAERGETVFLDEVRGARSGIGDSVIVPNVNAVFDPPVAAVVAG